MIQGIKRRVLKLEQQQDIDIEDTEAYFMAAGLIDIHITEQGQIHEEADDSSPIQKG